MSFSSRQARRDAERLAARAGLRAGLTVADVGGGNGDFARALAQAVAPTGRVFVTETPGKRFARLCRRLARLAPEIAPVASSQTDCGLPAGEMDAIFLRSGYHHLAQPAAFNASLRAALRPEGRLIIVDFPPRRLLSLLGRPEGVPEDRGGHGITASLAAQELAAAGLRQLEAEARWRGDRYCLVFALP
ncbi:MAG TPA: methyltransferase domain-containing protein [Terriglobales bacterium]|nr:methyltransferase domain-containing protein [Terriglobales bacterium]